MDPLDFLTNDELTRFFHCKKTEMSCMEQPHMFLNQLRDHNLIPEDKYKKVITARVKKSRVKLVYEVLDWLETTRPENITFFWKCVFKDHILEQYPVLRLMRESLLDESFTVSGKLPEKKEMKEAEEGKGEVNKAENQEEAESAEEEQSGPSSQATPMKKKRLRKLRYSSPIKKGKMEDIWNWPIHKICLPVVCADKEGSLHRDKLARGEKCILADKRWFYPIEFEEFAGKQTCRNWKTSIRCQNIPLLRLIQEGHLKCPKFMQRRAGSNEKLRPEFKGQPEASTSGSKSKMREAAGEATAGGAEAHDRGNGEENLSHFAGNRLPVTCGSASGILHKDRFVSGVRGMCIRMEDKWVTPVDFLKEDPTSNDSPWMSRILCLGKPFSDLLKKEVLRFHPFECECRLCSNQDQALREQSNDYDCFICDVPGCLLSCDQCPRAFHYECHVPAVDKNTVDPREKWICTYCVLKNTQGWRHPCQMTLQVAMKSPISARLLDCQYLLLCLYKEDKQRLFRSDPRSLASNYFKVIKKPMWLDKIAGKLQSKSYSTVGLFYSDVQLMFQNCAVLNQDNYWELRTKLTSLFEEEFRKVFFIHP